MVDEIKDGVRQSKMRRNSTIREESFHPKKEIRKESIDESSLIHRYSVEAGKDAVAFMEHDEFDPDKLDLLKSILAQTPKSDDIASESTASLRETAVTALDALKILKNESLFQTPNGVEFKQELVGLRDELAESVQLPAKSVRKSLAKCHDFIEKIDQFKQNNSTLSSNTPGSFSMSVTRPSITPVDTPIDEMTEVVLNKFQSVLREKQADIKSRKSTKKTLTNTTTAILTALDDLDQEAVLNSEDAADLKDELDDLRTELNDCIDLNKPMASLRKSLAKSALMIEKIDDLKATREDDEIEEMSEDIVELEKTLRQTQTALDGKKRMTKAMLQEESRKIASVINGMDQSVFDAEDEELQEKLTELKDQLEENVEDNKTVASLRKTLNNVGSIMEELDDFKVSRKSQLKRKLSDELDPARFSKKARNSIWVTKDRISHRESTAPDPEISLADIEHVLRKTKTAMETGKSVLENAQEIIDVVDLTTNGSITDTSGGEEIHEKLIELKDDLEKSLASKSTFSTLRQTLTQSLPSVMKAIEQESTRSTLGTGTAIYCFHILSDFFLEKNILAFYIRR